MFEFEHFKKERYGGTYAYKDIAFEVASAIGTVFKFLLIKEFQRIKEEINDKKLSGQGGEVFQFV